MRMIDTMLSLGVLSEEPIQSIFDNIVKMVNCKYCFLILVIAAVQNIAGSIVEGNIM